MSKSPSKALELPEVNFSEDGVSRYLHLGTPWIQGAMNIKEPFDLDLEYIQRMMAGLLFLKTASVAGRHAMQLGLGADEGIGPCDHNNCVFAVLIDVDESPTGWC